LEDRGAFHVTSDGTETEVVISSADDDAVVVGCGVIKPRLEGLDEGGNYARLMVWVDPFEGAVAAIEDHDLPFEVKGRGLFVGEPQRGCHSAGDHGADFS